MCNVLYYALIFCIDRREKLTLSQNGLGIGRIE
jgi:hypothetical protein